MELFFLKKKNLLRSAAFLKKTIIYVKKGPSYIILSFKKKIRHGETIGKNGYIALINIYPAPLKKVG